MTHQPPSSGSKMVRSQSATRNQSQEDQYKRRKSIAHVGERKSSGATLQVKNDRRASIRFDCSPRLGGSPSCRSRSLRSPSQLRIPQSSSGSNLEQQQHQQQTSDPSRTFNHSLSVPGDDSEFHRLRNFSITSKGIVNRGDSFRSKSNSTSRSSSPKTPTPDGGLQQVPEGVPVPEPEKEAACSPESSPKDNSLSVSPEGASAPRYRVWIMGFAGVGKTSLKLQFMTSEYICQLDNWREENTEKNVTIVLDGEEFELEITECSGVDDKSLPEGPLPDAFIVVYSVTNRRSYLHSKQVLSRVEPASGKRAIILVGNKTDLARLRTVTTLEGRSLAKEWGVKFIETSVAINHQVDELLVGVITQIRIRAKLNGKVITSLPTTSRANKATGLIKRLWRKTCMPNKSCDNLHSV